MSRPILPIMVGTAGHIDHGKSSLVRALTGIDPDRLKEEKDRGLTIDLGFAPLKLSDGRLMGMVDVPGHERFVKNMVAGSTALDLALLVVAADDSVMPQTTEHLEILDLLGVRRAVVALNKIDLVEPELADLAEEEIRQLLAGTQLAEAEIVRVSAVTGEGVAALRDHLEQLARAVEPRSAAGPFRMAVQRVFKLEGIGTVVTGIPATGAVRVGDELEFLPGGHRARVRAIHAFGGQVELGRAGHSTALSVPDARGADLRRGMVAATPGRFRSGGAIDAELRLLDTAQPLVHRTPIRFHVGTAERRGIVLALDSERIEPGATRPVRILLDEPVSCATGDRFLLRLQNPPRTIGGGDVLQIGDAPRHYRRSRVAERVQALVAAGTDPAARALEAVRNGGPRGASLAEIAGELAVVEEEARAVVEANAELHWHARGRRAFLAEQLEAARQIVHDSVARILRDKPHAASVPRTALRTTHDFPPDLKDAVLDDLVATGAARSLPDGRLLLVARLKPLPAADQRDLDAIVEHATAAAFRAPTLDELAGGTGLPASRVESLVARGVDEGRLQRVGDHVYADAVIHRALVAIRDNCLANDDVLDIPALRDALGTSRKYLIPLLEHVDALGLTRLRGGERRLLRSSDLFGSLGT